MTLSETLTLLFGAYGRANDAQQIAIYSSMLADVPPTLLMLAVKKSIRECKFLPSVAELLGQCELLNDAVNEDLRVKDWDEAWGEIQRLMQSTPWGKQPQFSRPEIAQAVNSFGWNELQRVLAADMPAVRAQMRRFYEDACARSKKQAKNEYALGKNPVGILGASKPKPRKKANELTSIGTVMGKFLPDARQGG